MPCWRRPCGLAYGPIAKLSWQLLLAEIREAYFDMNNLGARLWVRTSSFQHPVDSSLSLIQKHPANSKLQLLLPVLPEQQHAAPQVPDLSAFYYAVHISLSSFADQILIQKVLKDASLCCISLERPRRAAVTPDGHLHLVVSQSEYQNVGVVGRFMDVTGRPLLSPFDIQHRSVGRRRRRSC